MTNTTNELVFYQQGAAAGQQIDKYSMQPGCVDSENLDIFSDSQAIKGMPWSAKEEVSNEWIDVDPKERFYLASDGRVWDSQEDVWYNHDYFNNNANIINYQDGAGNHQALFGTPQKLMVAYSGDDWKTITIITDRLIYNIYSDWIHVQAGGAATGIRSGERCTDREGTEVDATSVITNDTGTRTDRIRCKFNTSDEQIHFTPGGFHATAFSDQVCMRAKITIEAVASNFNTIEAKVYKASFNWDTNHKIFDAYGDSSNYQEFDYEELTQGSTATIETYFDNSIDTSSSYNSPFGVYIHGICENPRAQLDVRFYKKEDWTYLYPKDRNYIEIEDEVYMEGLDSTQYYRLNYEVLDDEDGVPYHEFTTTNAFDLPDGYDIVAFARGFDFQYAFVNKGDLGVVYYYTDINTAAWDAGWRFPGTKFINALMIGNYVYVLAEKRGVRGLYIFSNGDMKLLVGANNRYTEDLDLINGKEIFNFTGIMANWRDKVVCATKDTVFMRGLTKLGINSGAFILKVDGEITDINTERGYLDVYFTKNLQNYRQSIQDDVNIKNYESEFSVTYPVQINSHLIEKEPLSLAISYNLPNTDTKLEAYISVNDNYFWSFLTDGNTTPTEGDKFKVTGLSGDYWLNFVEKKGNWLTFYLSGYLPYQTSNTKNLVSEDTEQTIAFTDFNHFKYLGEVKKENPEEIDGKHTYLNLTTKNDLPIVRKAQVKLVGITDTHVTPEIYGIRLLSEQFDK